MKVFKKNQVVIFVIALMLITAGYLNFIDTSKSNMEVQTSSDTLGDAMLVSTNALIQNETANNVAEIESEDIIDAVSSNETDKLSEDEKTEITNITSETTDDYFINTKMERDNMYSQIIESYQKMFSEESVSAEQKAIAQNEITKINNTRNGIMIAENLIKMKGFNDVIILVNNDSINVVVAKDKLVQEEVAQIQNIISREMETSIENIHISCK